MEILFANSRADMLQVILRHPYFGITEMPSYAMEYAKEAFHTLRSFSGPFTVFGKTYLDGAFARYTRLAEYDKVIFVAPVNLLNANKEDKYFKGYVYDFAYSIICFDDENNTDNEHCIPFDEWFDKYVKVINHPDSDEFKNEIFGQVGT